MAQAVLIVDDEDTLARNIASYLAIAGYETHIAGTAVQAQAVFDKIHPDITLLDLRLPDGDGLSLLRALRQQAPDHPVIMMTAYGDIETAVEAMKCGAHDFLRKPLALSEVKRLVERSLQDERRDGAIGQLARMTSGEGLDAILGSSPAIATLKADIASLVQAERALTAGAPPPALIHGETGTGKELVARAIHQSGSRARGPFIEINCAALPLDLVESELFGHERGAFTDARDKKIGLIEAADGGTLFLDEIGEMDLATQAKILKVMEDRMVRRVGGTRARAIDVRFIAATNRDLAGEVAKGTFREDLLFRLQVARFDLPPLRARGDDVLMLADLFLADIARRYGKPALSFSASARLRLQAHGWPGNVRELRNLLERVVLFSSASVLEAAALERCGIAVQAAHRLPDAIGPLSSQGISGIVPDERQKVKAALASAGWNVSKAARRLNMSRDQLRYRIDKFDLSPAAE